MEDLWRVRKSGVPLKDLADLAEYHRFLDRFKAEEEQQHHRDLLVGNAPFRKDDKVDKNR